MPRKVLAIANCRVSSDEQLLNNSIARQQASVFEAAVKLNVEIVRTWSGSVSSKAGTNVNRKDLLEMLETCKRNKNIKYAIFDEYDRYMRSVNEGAYFEVCFQELGVKVWYASESDTFNGNDAMAKFMRSMSAFKAEGSNEERQRKSISGQTTALKAGRYPFQPKPGYMRGIRSGIPDIHPVRGPELKKVLIRISAHLVTPTEALKELNNSPYTLERTPLKMDKFRKIATDPFYAGIVEINKQVAVRNEDGIHDPLITLDQHTELVRVFNSKKKNQGGPRKNGNPKYPLNNITSHDACLDSKNKGRLVGFDHSNGKNPRLVYQKYRCRSCGLYLSRQELHTKVMKQFQDHPIADEGISDFLEALGDVWKKREAQAKQDVIRIRQKIQILKEEINARALAAIDPSNASIKTEILSSVESTKIQVTSLTEELATLIDKADFDKERFLQFAYGFIENMGAEFLNLSPENRLRCKQLIFPAGFYIDTNKNVYTPEISPLITLGVNKKDLPSSEKSSMVRVRRL